MHTSIIIARHTFLLNLYYELLRKNIVIEKCLKMYHENFIEINL